MDAKLSSKGAMNVDPTTSTAASTTNVLQAMTSSDNNVKSNTTAKKPVKVVLTIERSIIPDERLRPTPSNLDGLSEEDEMDLRILGCELIQSSGILLRLPQVAMATGQVLFQRYYFCDSFLKTNMEDTAMACVVLASKIEEAPRRIRDVINVFNHLKQLRSGAKIEPLPLDKDYIDQKTNVIRVERKLLKKLGFCVHIKHPHKFIVTLLQVLNQEENAELMQTSWNYMNDCHRTDVFIRHTPEVIACACIFLSARVLRIPLPSEPCHWYELFDVTTAEIESVSKKILYLYTRPKPDQARLCKLQMKRDVRFTLPSKPSSFQPSTQSTQ